MEFILGFKPLEEDCLFLTAELLEEEDLAVEALPFPTVGTCPLTTVTLTPLVDAKFDDRVEPVEILVPTIPFDVTTVFVFLTDDECDPPR